MEALKTLPDIARLSNHVTRILGQNPGKFTLQGTNTYLVGCRAPFILIDTGEGHEAYLPLLERALCSSQDVPTERKPDCLVSDIIITHRHRDHYGGIPDVLRLLRKLYNEQEASRCPRIHKYSSPDSPQEEEFLSVLSALPPAYYEAAATGSAVHELSDRQQLKTDDGSASLEVLHTPGHTPDSVCLLLRPDTGSVEDAHSNVLFTADSVLGQGTAVFEDLGVYMQSLHTILSRRDDPNTNANFKVVYPGHGPVVDDGPELIVTYIKHRLDREAQIVGILKSTPSQSEGESEEPPSWTIWGVVGQIYKDYPDSLWLPAARGMGLHLKKLEGEGRAKYLGGEGIDQRWTLSSKF